MRRMRLRTLASLLAVAGCSAMPNAGPTTLQVLEQASEQKGPPFSLVEVSPAVVAATAPSPGEDFSRRFHGKPPQPTVGIGDSVVVTIWQGVVPGLAGAVTPEGGTTLPFSITSTNGYPGQITLPEQVVSTDGGVTVPFAGRIRAAGRTTFQIQRAIEHALAQNLIEPQVLVTVPRSASAMATVSGEAVGGMRISLSPGGDRLLDVIAAAGGPKAPLYETKVRLIRNGETGSIWMNRLVLDPEDNIYVWPGDSITLVRSPKTFSVFGATENNSQLPFNAPQLSLAQAIARAGGLQDARADPAGVFLFRFEQPVMGAHAAAPPSGSSVPTLYHLDLKRVDSYFLASRFAMKNDDLIYVAGASTNELQKFFTLIGTVTGPVISGALIAR